MSRLNEDKISAEDVFLMTNGGKDIFIREFNTANFRKNVSSLFRKDEKPSVKVKQSRSSNLWIYTDYTTGEYGNALQLIERLYNLTFQEAIDKIAWELGLHKKKQDYVKIPQIYTPQEEHKDILYEYTEIKFTTSHHKYWNAGHLYEDFLRKHNIFAASKLAVNKKAFKIPKDELCFVYIPEDLEYGKLKILRIGKNVLPQDKWRTNIPNEYLWSYFEHSDKFLEKLFVTKSRKDEMVAKLLGWDTISVQSENWQILDGNMPKIQAISQEQILNFGADRDGIDKCKIVQQKHNTLYYNTPENLVQYGVNDLFSYSKEFGLESLVKHMNKKLEI